MADTKISALTAITAPQDPTKMYIPLFAQDGSPLNARMNVTETLKLGNLNIDAADVLALRRSSNAELIRVYETYTDSTTFSRGVFGFRDAASGGTGTGSATTVLRIGTEKGSVGGTARAVSIVTDGTERINIAATANTITCPSNTSLSLGTGGIFRVRYINDASNTITAFDIQATGTKIGLSTSDKIGFWNATPVVQQVLATGGGATVDNVITLLQTLGLCKQS